MQLIVLPSLIISKAASLSSAVVRSQPPHHDLYEPTVDDDHIRTSGRGRRVQLYGATLRFAP